VSRSAQERFADILAAIDRCLDYRQHLDAPDAVVASMAYDAVLRNLAVIGEAVRVLPVEETLSLPDVPWDELVPLAAALRSRPL
jgi:uncharacterized protein with HEPN domain